MEQLWKASHNLSDDTQRPLWRLHRVTGASRRQLWFRMCSARAL